MVGSPAPRYTLQDPRAPPHYDDLFPPVILLCASSFLPIPQYLHINPQSLILDPPPPYSFLYPHMSSESSDSDRFLPNPPESGYEADSE